MTAWASSRSRRANHCSSARSSRRSRNSRACSIKREIVGVPARLRIAGEVVRLVEHVGRIGRKVFAALGHQQIRRRRSTQDATAAHDLDRECVQEPSSPFELARLSRSPPNAAKTPYAETTPSEPSRQASKTCQRSRLFPPLNDDLEGQLSNPPPKEIASRSDAELFRRLQVCSRVLLSNPSHSKNR